MTSKKQYGIEQFNTIILLIENAIVQSQGL